MGFIVSAPDGDIKIKPINAGAYYAVCIAIIDIGEQYSEAFDKYSRKAIFQWEIPDETVEIDGKPAPRVISETYTASLAENSNLRKVLESWRGRQFTSDELRGFDLENVLGTPCMLNIIHSKGKNDNVYAKIASVSRLPKGATVSTMTAKRLFCLDDPGAVDQVKDFPEWIQKRIKESLTYKQLTSEFPDMTPVAADPDVPF